MFLNYTLDVVYLFLYHLLHTFYSLTCLFYKWKEKKSRDDNQFKSFSLFKQKVTKLPSHVIFVVNWRENYLNLDEIALLIKWSIDLEIGNISLYDYQGYLIEQKDALQRSVSKLLDNFKFKINQTNGFTDVNYILEEEYLSSKIKIISNINVKQYLVSVSKEIVANNEKLGLKSSADSIQPQLVSRLLFSKLHLPDPDLIILCSPTPCLLNLLPWHIRLSEIVTLKLWRRLKQQDFLHVISRYSISQQHFGK